MNRKPVKGLLKHVDFIIIDLICMQLSFMLVYWIIRGWGHPYSRFSYKYLAIVLLFGQLFTIIVSDNYNGIIRRGRFQELMSVVGYTLHTLIAALIFLFVVHETTTISRLQMSGTLLLYIAIDYCGRRMNGNRIRRAMVRRSEKGSRSLVLITTGALVDEAMEKLEHSKTTIPQECFISGIVLTDANHNAVKGRYNVPVIPLNKEAITRIRSKWVDEVLILQSSYSLIDRDLFNNLADMGITVHYTLALLNDDGWPPVQLRKLGSYRVLTSSINFMTYNEALMKRLMDIFGGLVGCFITGLLFLFIAPAIHAKSPGPIFFKQDRVGRNGKVFKMYKFRSMYLDAEERKAALMEQNKMSNTLMFKMDDDPRIIGSEKKGKNGKPKGIGNFIRNTSIDEFPQFFNVLKGDMSLVGTRPPTLDEFAQYDKHHRARMTIKPGITGMWQVSGRSEITDFEEVVKLDKKYIENWSLSLDIKIILKTVIVMLTGRGAE